MHKHFAVKISLSLCFSFAVAGCTMYPSGEKAERQAALDASKPFEHRADNPPPTLPANPTVDDLIRYALLSNAELEQRYWEWRSAIEQIPQDGTQATNLAISASSTLNNGEFSRNRTTLSAFNDPMADIVWPDKLSTAARRALDNARAAGLRFRKAKLDLRAKVLGAYDDYALTAELTRLEKANGSLLQTTEMFVEARNSSGTAGQQDLLKVRNELDLSRNDLANLQSQLVSQRATLNALLSREPTAALPVPSALPVAHSIAYTDSQLLSFVAKQNPELAALADELKGQEEGIRLAKLQYVPDFSVSASTDLAGIAQSLSGMITIPLLRHEAIDAAIAQSKANLNATEAMRQQTGNDLGQQVVMDIAEIRNADRQVAIFTQMILPRMRQIVVLTRSAYENGQSSLLEVIDSQKSLIVVERTTAELRVNREKRLSEIEALTGTSLSPGFHS